MPPLRPALGAQLARRAGAAAIAPGVQLLALAEVAGVRLAPDQLNQRLAAASARTSTTAEAFEDNDLPDFTSRERDILARVVQGDSNERIAASLGVSVSTVKTHIGNILRKTGQTNRVRLIVWATRHLRRM